jgi:predicted transcriptional regulator
MEYQNVTLSLPRDLLKKAKILAASTDRSLTQLVRDSLEEKLSRQNRYHQAKKRQLESLAQGFNLGTQGRPLPSREALHER